MIVADACHHHGAAFSYGVEPFGDVVASGYTNANDGRVCTLPIGNAAAKFRCLFDGGKHVGGPKFHSLFAFERNGINGDYMRRTRRSCSLHRIDANSTDTRHDHRVPGPDISGFDC